MPHKYIYIYFHRRTVNHISSLATLQKRILKYKKGREYITMRRLQLLQVMHTKLIRLDKLLQVNEDILGGKKARDQVQVNKSQ